MRKQDSASHLPSHFDESEVRKAIGDRLRQIRASQNQQAAADHLRVGKRTYAGYERGEAEIGALPLYQLGLDGWNAHWILTGEGPERLEDMADGAESRAAYGSQDMSPTDLSMAIQLANEKIAASGLAPTPEQYGQFVLLLYKVLEGGLPTAEVTNFPG